MKIKRAALGMICSALLPGLAMAADSDVNLHGTLIEMPPCIINDNNVITVDFGEVMTTRVDGVNYKKKVDFTLDCREGATVGKDLVLGIVGNGTSFDDTLLKTNVDDLGIGFVLDFGIKYGINTFNLHLATVNNSNPYPEVNLWAVPIKNSDAILSGGAFRSTASLVIRYF